MKKGWKKYIAMVMVAMCTVGSTGIYAKAPTQTYHEVIKGSLEDGSQISVEMTIPNYIGTLKIDLPIGVYDEKVEGMVVVKESLEIPVISRAKFRPGYTIDEAIIGLFKTDYKGPKQNLVVESYPAVYCYDTSLKAFVAEGQGGEGGGTLEQAQLESFGVGVYGGKMNYYVDGAYYFSAGYPLVLMISPEDEAYYLQHGQLSENQPYKWPGLEAVLRGKASTPSLAKGAVAKANQAQVLIDGKGQSFEAYTIGESNYFKLRDIAQVLSGTAQSFEVTWDTQKNAICLIEGVAYTSQGNELIKGDGKDKQAIVAQAPLFLGEQQVALEAYTIDGSSYFKLRDLGDVLGFSVGWDQQNNCITIKTGK